MALHRPGGEQILEEMFLQVMLGPFATLWILPWRLAASCLFVTGSVGGLSLGLKYVRAHYIRIPEINISVVSTSMLGMCLLVLLFMTLVQRWEDNFDSLPWTSLQHSAKTRLICPFTGERVIWSRQALMHCVHASIIMHGCAQGVIRSCNNVAPADDV